jgi:ribosomal protein L37E
VTTLGFLGKCRDCGSEDFEMQIVRTDTLYMDSRGEIESSDQAIHNNDIKCSSCGATKQEILAGYQTRKLHEEVIPDLDRSDLENPLDWDYVARRTGFGVSD